MHAGAPTLGSNAIPGDVGGLHSAAKKLESAHGDLENLGRQIGAHKIAGWSGDAAKAFRAQIDQFPPALHSAAATFADVAGAISGFAGRLDWFQHEAIRIARELAQYRANLAELQRHEATVQQRIHETGQALRSGSILKALQDATRADLTKMGAALDHLDNSLHDTTGHIHDLERQASDNHAQYLRAVADCAHAIESHTHPVAGPHAHKSSAPPASYNALIAAATGFAGEIVAAGPVNAALAWATDRLGSKNWNQRCLAFCFQAYESGARFPLEGYFPNHHFTDSTSASECWDWVQGEKGAGGLMSIGATVPPPKGALVFFAGTPTHPAGHVVISLGNGKAISTDDRQGPGVHPDTLGNPPFSGWWLP
jgi:uncharacterized protein YukE/cell wall-associated NlpC family hydrolase